MEINILKLFMGMDEHDLIDLTRDLLEVLSKREIEFDMNIKKAGTGHIVEIKSIRKK